GRDASAAMCSLAGPPLNRIAFIGSRLDLREQGCQERGALLEQEACFLLRGPLLLRRGPGDVRLAGVTDGGELDYLAGLGVDDLALDDGPAVLAQVLHVRGPDPFDDLDLIGPVLLDPCEEGGLVGDLDRRVLAGDVDLADGGVVGAGAGLRGGFEYAALGLRDLVLQACFEREQEREVVGGGHVVHCGSLPSAWSPSAAAATSSARMCWKARTCSASARTIGRP